MGLRYTRFSTISIFRQSVALCAFAVAAFTLAGCAELEPMVEPKVQDLQLTVETLKTQLRDAQGTITELRAELETRQQELAEAHVVSAQLEGRVREAERHVGELRHVIDLQREELMAAKAERVRITRSILQVQGQLKDLRKQVSNSGLLLGGSLNLAPASASNGGSPAEAKKTYGPANSRSMTTTAQLKPGAALLTEEHQVKGVPVRGITVKAGDTLYGIARIHRMRVERLKSLNDLTDNIIEVGQTLWVSADRTPRPSPGPER